MLNTLNLLLRVDVEFTLFGNTDYINTSFGISRKRYSFNSSNAEAVTEAVGIPGPLIPLLSSPWVDKAWS